MNIYICIEIAPRELDSKLLLATLAASKGHEVVVSDLTGIMTGIKRGVLAPGIFHDKSLTPNDKKITRHQFVIDNGFIITSIDEENNLINYGYDQFARDRYSEQTIRYTSAIFGWGPEDVEALKRIYPKHSSKIHMTGSPRVDLLKSIFYKYWDIPKVSSKKPYLLVSSNLLSFWLKPFHERIKHLKSAGYLKRDPQLFKKMCGEMAESYHKMASFVEAIQYLADNNNGYDIVLRPHPTDDIEAWKIFLEDIPNVHVIREGSAMPWINNAFALMHNGCTTALEATIYGKPVVTYVPFKQEYSGEVANELGYRVESLKDLSFQANALFDSIQSGDQKEADKQIPEAISKKIYLDGNELAAEKMIKVWESLDKDELSRSSNWMKFQWLMKAMKFKKNIGNGLKKLSQGKIGPKEENYKFPLLDKNDIRNRVKRLENILGIKENLECQLISERTILIKRL